MNLTGKDFWSVDLRNSNFSNANLTRASLGGANLLGANLTGAIFTEASFNSDTKWPIGFSPAGRGMWTNGTLDDYVADTPNVITLAGPPPGSPVRVVKRGTGTLILDIANSHSGGTVVEAGEVIVRNPLALGSGVLVIQAGAKLTLDIGTRRVSLPSMTIAGAGTLDLGAGSVALAAGSYDLAALRGLIVSGRNNGSWTGTGITSGSARGLPFREVGYRVLQDGSALVGFSAVGDGNMDGSVNIQDLIAISTSGKYGSGTTDAAWWEGDFNYDGVVNITDLINLSTSGLYGAGSYMPVAATSQIGPQQSEASPSDVLSGLTATPTGETLPGDAEPAVGPWQVDSAGQVAKAPASSDRISGSRSVGRLAWAAIANQGGIETPKDSKSARWRMLSR